MLLDDFDEKFHQSLGIPDMHYPDSKRRAKLKAYFASKLREVMEGLQKQDKSCFRCDAAGHYRYAGYNDRNRELNADIGKIINDLNV
jgi:hypothetical protein